MERMLAKASQERLRAKSSGKKKLDEPIPVLVAAIIRKKIFPLLHRSARD